MLRWKHRFNASASFFFFSEQWCNKTSHNCRMCFFSVFVCHVTQWKSDLLFGIKDQRVEGVITVQSELHNRKENDPFYLHHGKCSLHHIALRLNVVFSILGMAVQMVVFVALANAQSKSCDAGAMTCEVCDASGNCQILPMEGNTNGGEKLILPAVLIDTSLIDCTLFLFPTRNSRLRVWLVYEWRASRLFQQEIQVLP